MHSRRLKRIGPYDRHVFTLPRRRTSLLPLGRRRSGSGACTWLSGTPAEMRSVAKMLNEAGWTVHGLLLPGFGPEMPRIADYTPQDWINATAEKTRELRRTYRMRVLVGYSMGGAVSINAARLERPDQLVLISPFWRLGGSWQNRIWPVLRLIFRPLQTVPSRRFQ
ncbi:MAG: alpha/beta fold hydrolase [Caldilineaceae bacterium]